MGTEFPMVQRCFFTLWSLGRQSAGSYLGDLRCAVYKVDSICYGGKNEFSTSTVLGPFFENTGQFCLLGLFCPSVTTLNCVQSGTVGCVSWGLRAEGGPPENEALVVFWVLAENWTRD